MTSEQKTHSPLEAIRQWYRGFIGSQSALGECGAEGLERMAHDIGVSTAELHQLAKQGQHSAARCGEGIFGCLRRPEMQFQRSIGTSCPWSTCNAG